MNMNGFRHVPDTNWTQLIKRTLALFGSVGMSIGLD